MKSVNLILAAGSQERWNSPDSLGLPKIKQLVRIGDEILLQKIQRQFRESIVVTKDETIKKYSQKWFEPVYNDITLATLFSTKDLWQDWTTILLGDVNYGAKTVKKIKSQKEQIMFYGNKGEIFCLKFTMQASLFIVQCIHNIITSPLFKNKYGKLWNLYRQLNGFDFREHKMGLYFTQVSDCKDFDNVEQYLKYAGNKQI